MAYDHIEIEKKWQLIWEKDNWFRVNLDDLTMPKYYILDMFPYPSGSGLHLGHPRGYTATDVFSRFKRLQGYNVLHPMGWDAFGLPAEQYALKTNSDPHIFTKKNISVFKNQLQNLGFSYDFSKEINTTDSQYYRWTQWIFIQLYNKGLAELKNIDVNWCEKLNTVLANEEVLVINNNMVSERGHFPVIKKKMKQWVLKITHYAEQLLSGLDELDWPNSVKSLQKNWIGKSNGIVINFKIENKDIKIPVFTTRADTLFGVSYLVISPDNDLVKKITTDSKMSDVIAYCNLSIQKSEFVRINTKKKTGIFTGAYAIIPFSNKKIPIWVGDYVLNSYGTGAVMATPAHDQRDYDFAKKYNLPIKQVIIPKKETNLKKNIDKPYLLDGKHIDSLFLNGLSIKDAKLKILKKLENNNFGFAKTSYHLRDWIFARQRYWGEPIPIIHWEDGKISTLKESDLPLVLPKIPNISKKPGQMAPLESANKWIDVTRIDGVKGKREACTMPQWAGSCWYYLAYLLRLDDQNSNKKYLDLNSDKALKRFKHWLPVDLYIGGQEHAVLHLLYARFWHKVLFDLNIVDTKEPFKKLVNQGMLLGTDGEKMSKSRGNVISPDVVVDKYGADALRLYEMFMGPIVDTLPWNDRGLYGSKKWLNRVYELANSHKNWLTKNENDKLKKCLDVTIEKVTRDFNNLSINTAIAQMMIFINECYKCKNIPITYFYKFLQLLNPICPHVTEEISQMINLPKIFNSSWPVFDKNIIKPKRATIVIQINGKFRGKIIEKLDLTEQEVFEKCKTLKNIANMLTDINVKKIIYIKNKLINIVI